MKLTQIHRGREGWEEQDVYINPASIDYLTTDSYADTTVTNVHIGSNTIIVKETAEEIALKVGFLQWDEV